MHYRIIRFAIVTTCLVFLGGCTTVPREGGFGDVEKLVADRTAMRIHWNQGSADDQSVEKMILASLQEKMTVDQAVQIALLNNRSLQATYEELGIAQADLVQAGLLKNPVFDGLFRFPDRAPRGPNVELAVTQDFIDILFIPARKKLAASQFEVAKLRVAEAVVNLAANVRSTFYRLQGAQQMLEMRRTIVQVTEASADATRRLHEAGNTNDLSLSNEQVLYAQSKLDLAEAEAEVMENRERLNTLLGVWGLSTQWTIGDRLPELPQTDPSPQGMESLAMRQRLDLAAARGQIKVTGRALGLSRQFWFLPELSIGIDTEREPAGGHVTGPSVSAAIPIFDQGQATLAAGNARLRQAQQQYQGLAIEIRSQIRAARNRMVAARARAEYYNRVVLPLRTKIVEQTQLQFNGMFVSVFQLLQTKQAQIDAGREYIDALRNYWIARSELEKTAGGSLKGLPLESPDKMPASTQPVSSSNDSKTQQPKHNHGD